MKKGFTLVELLVVVVIVTVAVVVAVPSFTRSRENSKNQRAQAILVDLASAVQTYNSYRGASDPVVSGRVRADAFTSATPTCGSVAGNADCLRAHNLLKAFPLDVDNRYLGYAFQVCPGAVAECCPGTAVAYMRAQVGSARFLNKCAWINHDGTMGNNFDSTQKLD